MKKKRFSNEKEEQVQNFIDMATNMAYSRGAMTFMPEVPEQLSNDLREDEDEQMTVEEELQSLTDKDL